MASVRQVVILAITDQGEGIPEQEISKITERFYRINAQTDLCSLSFILVKHSVNTIMDFSLY